MELRDIEIFLALAEELHFGRTAEQLHVSPARVSQAIKKQEREIGAELFVRTSRNVRLTPVGERLRNDLASGYRQIQEAISGAAAAAQGVSGVVRIGFSSPWCGDLVVKAADVFRQRHPLCEVQIIERLMADRFGPLRTRELDLQLAELPAEEPDIAVGPILFREPRALMMSVDHPLARNETVSIEDYGDCVVIGIVWLPDYFREFHLPLRTPSGRPIARGPQAVSFQESQSLIGAGKGVQPTSMRAALYHARPDIVFVPFHDAPTVDYGVTWLTEGDSVKIHAFTRALLDVASGE